MGRRDELDKHVINADSLGEHPRNLDGATDLARKLIDRIEAAPLDNEAPGHVKVIGVGVYRGSGGGPSHIFRDDHFYRRDGDESLRFVRTEV